MNPHRQSKFNCLKGQISLSRTIKLQTLANACQIQAGENSAGQNLQDDWYNEFPWIRQDAIEV